MKKKKLLAGEFSKPQRDKVFDYAVSVSVSTQRLFFIISYSEVST